MKPTDQVFRPTLSPCCSHGGMARAWSSPEFGGHGDSAASVASLASSRWLADFRAELLDTSRSGHRRHQRRQGPPVPGGSSAMIGGQSSGVRLTVLAVLIAGSVLGVGRARAWRSIAEDLGTGGPIERSTASADVVVYGTPPAGIDPAALADAIDRAVIAWTLDCSGLEPRSVGASSE